MAKTIAELIEEQKAFEESRRRDVSLADSESTRAPSELSTAGVIKQEDEEDGKYLRLAESIAGEVGGSIAVGAVTTPLLGGGPVGIGAYIAVNGLSNFGLNYWAQSHRDPDAAYSPEEGLATTAISTMGPLATYKKMADLSRLGKVAVTAGEGTAMAVTEDLLRQGLEIGAGKRQEISLQQTAFSGTAGLIFGGGTGYLTSGQNFHKLGASKATVNSMRKTAEVNAAKKISSIDSMLENPEVTGEYRDLLLREKREIKETLETVRTGDKEYLESLKADAVKQEQESRQALVDRINKLKEPEVGEGTVLRPREELETQPPAPKPTDTPTFNFKQAEVAEDARISRGNLPELNQLDDLRKVVGVEGDVKSMDDISKLMQEPANKDKLLKFLQDNPIEVSHNKDLKEATGEAFYEITDGNHRYELAKMAGIDDIPVSDKSAKEIGIEVPTAAKVVEPAVAPQPAQPTKLTTEQKLEALERMGMSDEDLSKLLEGKSEIIPLNLSAFTTDEGVQRAMAGVLEQLSDKIKTSRVKTDKESLIKQVIQLRKRLDPELDEAKFVQQIAKETEDIIFKAALADSMTLSAFDNLYKKIDTNTDLNDPAIALEIMADLDRVQLLAEGSSIISSSSGKLLQSRKVARDQMAANINTIERKALKAEKDLVEELIKHPEKLNPSEIKKELDKLGGLKNVKAFLNEIRLVRDPHKLGKLLEISKKSTGEKFSRVGKELIYDSVLSAPPTQAAAAGGNAMMTLFSLTTQGVGGLVTGSLEQTRMALRTSKYLLYGIDDAFRAAQLAAANSQGSMSLNNHYEKIGERALAMESTGLSGAIGETVENTGELLAFGPKGLVFQDEFYRHLFGKAQARALLAEEYKQLVKRGEAPIGQIQDYMESRLSRYFVDGKRFKTKNDVEMEAMSKIREQGLKADESKDFFNNYVRDNWSNKLASEIEYMKDFGDKITFQRELSSDYGVLEAGATKLGELRQKSSVLELVQLFLRTPTNMFMELGGTASGLALLPGVNKVTFKRTLDELRSDNPSIRAQARGRQVVGAGLWASALFLADQGITTGAGPQDYKERETKMSTGWEPHAINMTALKRYWDTGNSGGDQMGDTYLPLSRLGSIADVYGVAATALRASEDNSMPDDLKGQVISSAQLALTTLIADKTYLANISELNDGLFRGKWEEGGKSGANALFTAINRMATPSIMKAAAQLNDPYLREINEPMEQFKMALASTRRELDPKRDELGIPKPASQYDSVGQAINYLSPVRVERLRSKEADEKDVKEGRASKVGEKLFTKEDEARMILAEVGGRFKFSRPDDGIPGLNLKKLKVQKDYGFGLEQTLYDRWQQIYSELNPAGAIIKAYNKPKYQRMGKVPKGSPITNSRRLTIDQELRALRGKALGQLVKENPELKAQFFLLKELTKKVLLEGETAPRKVIAPELAPLLD
jgi:hypothetical protein